MAPNIVAPTTRPMALLTVKTRSRKSLGGRSGSGARNS